MNSRTVIACWSCILLHCSIAAAQMNALDSTRLDYTLKTTVEAYNKVGRQDAKWDSDARVALDAFARMHSVTNGSTAEYFKELDKALRKLSAEGCDDPFIRYLFLRFVYSDSHSSAENAKEFVEVAKTLQGSQYPEIRKFFATYWAHKTLAGAEPKRAEVRLLLQEASSHLAAALTDKSMPLVEADQAVDQLMSASFWSSPGRWETYHALEPSLTNRWADSCMAWLMKGRGYLSFAWQARGIGYANTVSDQGWKLMTERLDIAAKALEKAWKLDPTDTRVCQEMMRVELGQNKGRERMELWFQRGMKLDPSDYDLCYEKIEYLRPRWYGSIEEMIQFGRECGTNTNWRGRVPLWRALVYDEVLRELPRDGRNGFWTRPSVWSDVRAAFERFFQLNPDQVSWRHNYARYAFQCEQWQEFLKQTQMFPWTNHAYFGGAEQFNQMVKSAQEHVNKK